MLREFGKTRQEGNEYRRRWFWSPKCDLILWVRDDESLHGFQVCYDKTASEHALTWIEDAGYSHMAVDKGSPVGWGEAVPLLVPDGAFSARYILGIVEAEGTLLPQHYRDVISSRIRELAERQEAAA